MKRILVATDFSARSDRAIRRATFLARAHGSSITLLHVIDDDQPKRILRAERKVASALIADQARSLREIDGLKCDYRLELGTSSEGIAKAVEALDCDLLVLGAHRHRALKDVFVGTTAERTIRACRRPVLMANGPPTAAYRHVLVAVDFSDCSADAVGALRNLGLDRQATVSVVHVTDPPGASLLPRASLPENQVEEYLLDEEERAGGELAAFLDRLDFSPASRIVRRTAGSVARSIGMAAQDVSADLVVLGTHGRTGIARFLLGSVAEELLRTGESDVLAVPPRPVAKPDPAVLQGCGAAHADIGGKME